MSDYKSLTKEQLIKKIVQLQQRVAELEDKQQPNPNREELTSVYANSIINSLIDIVIILNSDATIRTINKATMEILGYSEEDLIGKPFGSIIEEEEEEDSIAILLANGLIGHIEKTLIAKDGRKVPVLYSGSVIKKSSGVIEGLICVAKDALERKQAEKALQEKERLSSLLMNSLPHPAMIIRKDRTVIAANHIARESGAKVGGYCWQYFGRCEYIPEKDKRYISCLKTIPPKGTHCIFCLADKALQKQGKANDPCLNAFGKIWDTYWIPLNDKEYLHYAIDITDRIKAEQEIRSSEERFRLIFENAKDAVLWADTKNGLIILCNKAAEALLEREKNEIIGYHQSTLHPKEKSELYISMFNQHVDGKGAIDQEAEIITKSGKIIPVHISAVTTTFGEESIIQGIFRDITEQKKYEKQIKKESRRKDEFLALLGHELRNPLAPIANAIEVISLADDNPKVRAEMLQISMRQCKHMVRLVDDLLDISRITKGKIELHKKTINLSIIVNDAIETNQSIIEEKKLNLDVSLPQVETFVNADSTRLHQAISNVLNNAFKFTPIGGRIWLEIALNKDKVDIRIKDTGVGIPASMLPEKIFEKFIQADSSSTRAHGGLGLGLALAKNLIVMHDGTISAMSSGKNQGSEFLIRLPIAK